MSKDSFMEPETLDSQQKVNVNGEPLEMNAAFKAHLALKQSLHEQISALPDKQVRSIISNI